MIIEKRKINKTTLEFGIILTLIFIRPHINISSDIFSVYLFDLATIFLVFISLFRYRMKIPSRFGYLGMQFILSICILFVMFFINIMINGFVFDTLFSYMKLIYYFIMIYYFIIVFNNLFENRVLFEKILRISILLNFLIVILQMFDLPLLSDVTYFVFGDNKLRTIWSGYVRTYGAFYNANWFGLYLVLCLSFIDTELIEKKLDFKKYLIYFVILVFMILVSGSRTSLIGALIVITFHSIHFLRLKNLIRISLLLTLLVLGVKSFISIEIFTKTFARFFDYFQVVIDYGFNLEMLAGSRWEHWIYSFEVFQNSPFFGSDISEFIPHNTYLSMLITFGFFGTIIIIWNFISLFILFNSHQMSLKKLFYKILVFIISFSIILSSGDYFFSTQVMLMVFAYLVYVLVDMEGEWKNEKIN